MGLSDAYLAMMWDEIERNNLWDCVARDIGCALMGYPGF